MTISEPGTHPRTVAVMSLPVSPRQPDLALPILRPPQPAEPLPGPSPEPAATQAYSENARNLYERGRQAEKTGRLIEAYTAYSQAAKLAPNVRKYLASVQRLEGPAGAATRPQKAEETAPRAEAERHIPRPTPRSTT